MTAFIGGENFSQSSTACTKKRINVRQQTNTFGTFDTLLESGAVLFLILGDQLVDTFEWLTIAAGMHDPITFTQLSK